MKILQLCNKIPYPPNDGGAIAVLNLAVSLARKGHEVWMLAMSTQKHHIAVREIPSGLTELIHFHYVPVNTGVNPIRLLRNLFFSDKPYHAERFYLQKFADKMLQLLEEEKFDIVQLEGLYLRPYIELIRAHSPAKIVYRAHNVESEIWQGVAKRQKNPLKKAYLKILARRLKNYEHAFINQYDFLLPISDVDLSKLIEMGNTRPTHLTYTGIAEENFRTAGKRPPRDIFFIGALDWIPNQEGLIWLLEEVWRPLKKQHPSLEFHVAGRNAPEWIGKKCTAEKAVFHGEVEHAHSFLDDHDIMLVPLFAGSGLRIKIVEAMARSKVILTTPAGAKGLPALKGNELVVAGQAHEWINHIQDLFEYREKYNALEVQAFHYAKQNFSSESIVTNLLYFYSQQGLC